MADLLICQAPQARAEFCIGPECGAHTFERGDVVAVRVDCALWGDVPFDPERFRVVWLPLVPKDAAPVVDLLRPEVFSLGGSIGDGRARAAGIDLDALLAMPDPAALTPDGLAALTQRKAPPDDSR